jgi:hypothetical protein
MSTSGGVGVVPGPQNCRFEMPGVFWFSPPTGGRPAWVNVPTVPGGETAAM